MAIILCDTKEKVSNGDKICLLVPDHMVCKYGEAIMGEYHDSHIGEVDMFAFVADCNREALSKTPMYRVPRTGNKHLLDYDWYRWYKNSSCSSTDIEKSMKRLGSLVFKYRHIGIELACYDERNATLPFPIKVTKNIMNYNDAPISLIDTDI